MSDYMELEVKILDIDTNLTKKKLNDIGATFKKEVLQKIYTYDCYNPITMYNLALSDYKITKTKNSLLKIANVYSYIEPIISDEEKRRLEDVCGYNSLSLYIKSNI